MSTASKLGSVFGTSEVLDEYAESPSDSQEENDDDIVSEDVKTYKDADNVLETVHNMCKRDEDIKYSVLVDRLQTLAQIKAKRAAFKQNSAVKPTATIEKPMPPYRLSMKEQRLRRQARHPSEE
jgi:hypothetical protein